MNKLTNASFSQLVVQYERLVYTVCFQTPPRPRT